MFRNKNKVLILRSSAISAADLDISTTVLTFLSQYKHKEVYTLDSVKFYHLTNGFKFCTVVNLTILLPTACLGVKNLEAIPKTQAYITLPAVHSSMLLMLPSVHTQTLQISQTFSFPNILSQAVHFTHTWTGYIHFARLHYKNLTSSNKTITLAVGIYF
jgi:hypothetical protein